MRTVAVTLALAAVMVSGAEPPPKRRLTPADLEKSPVVIAIRARYRATNQLKGLTKKKKTLFGMSAEGADLTAFFDAETLRKLEATFFAETGKTELEIHFVGDQLDFILDRSAHYREALDPHGASHTEDRYYFDSGHLAWWLSGKRVVSEDDPEFARAEKRFLEWVEQLREAARTPGDELHFDGHHFKGD